MPLADIGVKGPSVHVRLRDELKGRLPDTLLGLVPSSFEVVGSREGAVAIVEIPEELAGYERVIGEAILRIQKNVKAVYRKLGGREGEYRIRRLKLIAGEPITEVVHKEHGYRLKLDIARVYFSPREATERQRIASMVAPGECVMVMFAGVGPYAVAIARAQPSVGLIPAIELNPAAYCYMVENVRLNRLEGVVEPVLGDVRERAWEWVGCCDRVVMPLPRGAHLFIREALLVLKPKGGIVHFYHWEHESELFEKGRRLFEGEAARLGFETVLLNRRIVSPYAPRVYKVVYDFQVKPCGSTRRPPGCM